MRKITITEALNELKLYNSKINKAISDSEFVGAAKKSSDKIGHITKEEFNNRAKSSYQSVLDLIRNRNSIKSAIVKSNATTEVEVNGKKMTVAEAIERKTSIEYELNLLSYMSRQYSSAVETNNRENRRVDNKVDELLGTLIGKDSDKKVSKEDQESVSTLYRQNNEYELVDPLGIYQKIQDLENETDGFISAVDTCLSVSNAITMIEVD